MGWQDAPVVQGQGQSWQSAPIVGGDGIPTGPRKTGTIVDQIPGYDGPVPAATVPIQTQPITG